MDIVFTDSPTADETEAVSANIGAHAEIAWPGAGYRSFGFLLKDPQTGEIEGGLTGYALYQWMFVQFLSVSEKMRGKGYGAKLMERAEAWARQEGLDGIWLDTFSFQAPDFYEKLGFEVFGTIEDHPVGARRIFMKKRLVRETG
ncbi:GNAT family N-acetyltransferase [Pelagibacterium xiamenense]|uniref:GNAT family N-acetyltransferase n=1 Tax=Pelagibacterium xiamenense TaxID=2901140 RepID=UPI001E57AF5F|nr:GNAT family N-acetyltransferase [Pelagibacterium xiamenense]MCD7058299.1 GNAT family N-acetyltransferase [Pelagibacterium xiamenense]